MAILKSTLSGRDNVRVHVAGGKPSDGQDVEYTDSVVAMGSACSLHLLAPDRGTAQAWCEAAWAEVRRIEHKFSRYRPDSLVSRINAAAGGDPVVSDAETDSLLDFAGALHLSSDGRFDATSGVLRQVWDFRKPTRPDPARLAAVRRLIGWQWVERSPGQVRLAKAGMELDFGGFGKEYAADRVAAVLRELGARRGWVNLGGDLHALGPRQDGRDWTIGIQDPRHPQGVVAEVALGRGGLATSGDYERHVVLDGKRCCHVLDARTGWPVSHWRSVSVAAPLCIVAGGWATLGMLAAGEAQALLEVAGCAYLAIDAEGHPHTGPASLKDRGGSAAGTAPGSRPA